MHDLHGLTETEVRKRTAEGKINLSNVKTNKTLSQIFRDNTFTLFNLINVILAAFVFVTGSYRNMVFLLLAVCNTIIGTVQEYRAKRVLDKLRLLTAPTATVIRDEEEKEINVEEIVPDDIILLTPGRQVPADGIVLHSENCDINEALLTGESDSVSKIEGNTVLSGSFVQSGRAYCRITAVGNDSYVNRLAASSKEYKKVPSELRDVQNGILKITSILIIPLGIALFLTQIFRSGDTWQNGILSATAGVLGVLPEGLLLLTSISLAVGSIKLAAKRTLTQQMQGIETLARVDMLCLDKTGTLTTGQLNVQEIRPCANVSEDEIHALLATVIAQFADKNATSEAIARYIDGVEQYEWICREWVPFSSVYKWSGADFGENGSWCIGAPEVVGGIPEGESDGRRVLTLSRSRESIQGKALPGKLEPVANIFISDTLRETAPDTLDYFAKQDVSVKIISGDNPRTVSAIAVQAGVKDPEKYISCDDLPESDDELREVVERTTVFGRVSPASKKRIVAALQQNGHVVAMTGDGVNDVLALKQADCGIAMASGSDATRGVAQIVLLDSDFSTLPSVVLEGRRIINNIERVSSMYLVKTGYSFLLSLVFIFIAGTYPFVPIYHTLIGSLTVGIPSFFLALEPNGARVKKGYLPRALTLSLPTSLTVFILIMLGYFLAPCWMTAQEARFIAPAITCIVGLMTIFRLSRPFTPLRVTLLAAMTLGAVAGFTWLGELFTLPPITTANLIAVLIMAVVSYPMVSGIMWLMKKIAYFSNPEEKDK